MQFFTAMLCIFFISVTDTIFDKSMAGDMRGRSK